MKKIFLLMFAAAAALGSWATDEVTATFTSNKLDVALANSTEFVAFQMDITLDASVTVSDFTKTGRLAEGAAVTIAGEPQSSAFQLLYNVISSDANTQTIRVIAYNLGNNAIQDAEGSIFTATLSAEPTAVSIDNILFVDREGLAEAELAYVEAQKGTDVLLGDVTNDGVVNILDASAVIDIVNNKIDSSYNLTAADVDQNGSVNVLDASLIVDIVNNK